MTWPWINRLEAERRIARAEEQVESSKRIMDNLIAACDQRVQQAQAETASVRDENKILIDRIAQLSGQPPIFHPVPTPPPSPQGASTGPGPKTRVTFDDVHRKTREAIDSKQIGIVPARTG